MRSRILMDASLLIVSLASCGCLYFPPIGVARPYVNSVPVEYHRHAYAQMAFVPNGYQLQQSAFPCCGPMLIRRAAVPEQQFVQRRMARAESYPLTAQNRVALSPQLFFANDYASVASARERLCMAPTGSEACCNPCELNSGSVQFDGAISTWPVSVESSVLNIPTAAASPATQDLTSNEVALGRKLFFDASLSRPVGQSCATCHSPDSGFADPDASMPVSRGAIRDRFGARNAPSAAYASFSPPLHYDEKDESWVGGLFWDGRANTLSDQAKGPPLNPLEMNSPDKPTLVASIRTSDSGALFQALHGGNSLHDSRAEQATDEMADAIAAYESSAEVNSFSSKYDAVLKGYAMLSEIEAKGLELFNGKAGCVACHPSAVIDKEPGPLFTDFTYDNVGIPKNQQNPYLSLPRSLNPDGADFTDHGLMTTVAKLDPARAPEQDGKFKVPTLRNVGRTAPYGHNGYFKSLKDIVHFYNTRDVAAASWEKPEIPQTVNRDELGHLELTDAEEDAIVAFLLTLSDGWQSSGK